MNPPDQSTPYAGAPEWPKPFAGTPTPTLAPTPRTDAALLHYSTGEIVKFHGEQIVSYDFARFLERALLSSQAELAAIKTPSIPKTDAVVNKSMQEKEGAYLTEDLLLHARALERELADAKAECERLRFLAGPSAMSDDSVISAYAELTRLRAEVERLKALGSWAHTCIHHTDAERANAVCPCCANARAEKAEADTARLDWLERNPGSIYASVDCETGKLEHFVGVSEKDQARRRGCVEKTVRDAIDAAIKGTP
jgi:hypothetical protein